MDWEDIVSHLAHTRPALVVDRGLRVRFANAPMQDLLGWRGDDLAGAGWVKRCVPARERSAVHRLVADGLRGAAADGDLTLVLRDGRRVATRVALTPEVSGRTRALVVVASEVRPAPGAPPPCDCWCDVSRDPETLGVVVAMRFLDPARDAVDYVGRPVDAVLAELGCTAADRAASALLNGATTDLVHVTLPEADPAFRVVTAHALDERRVRIAVRCLDSRLLPSMVEAKVKRVAEARGLSDRERQVLQLLLRGRGLEDIATMLEIAPRTVKFHQANVLQKLGAESRLDLLRVVL